MVSTFAELLRLPIGPVDLTGLDPNARPGFDGDKDAGKLALAELGPELSDLQERLFAERSAGSARRLLLVLQGMDTSGKGGVLRHTVGLVDPQGCRHHQLQGAHRGGARPRLPVAHPPGGARRRPDRRVRPLALRGRADRPGAVAGAEEQIESRYDAINEFERELVAEGTTIIKCMLHISPEEQRERLLARLDDPTKHWKFNPADIDEREKWPDYREAYEIALERTNTEVAPWFVVPSDRKWYRNLAIGELLLQTLQAMAPQWPVADFDVAEQKQRLLDEKPPA